MGLLLESGMKKLTMGMMRLLMMVIMRLLMMLMMTRHELFDVEERAGNIDGTVFCVLLLLLVTNDFVTCVFRSDFLGFIPPKHMSV